MTEGLNTVSHKDLLVGSYYCILLPASHCAPSWEGTWHKISPWLLFSPPPDIILGDFNIRVSPLILIANFMDFFHLHFLVVSGLYQLYGEVWARKICNLLALEII